MRPDWLLLLCTLFACWSGELQEWVKRPAAVSGRVTGGTSNAGVAVLAVQGFPLPAPTLSTKSGPDGRFILTDVWPGPLNMVANDCLGFAAVKGITAFPAETNEIGDLELRPISEFPEVDGLGCTGQPNARAERFQRGDGPARQHDCVRRMGAGHLRVCE